MSDPTRDELLEAFRAHRTPPPERAAANWEAVRSHLPTSTPEGGGGSGSGGLRRVFGVLGVTATVVLVWSVWPSPAPEPRPSTPQTREARSEPPAPAASPGVRSSAPEVLEREAPTAAVAVPEEAPSPPEATPRVGARRGKRETAPKTAATAPGSMADEVRLIARAKAELSRGEHTAALHTTEEHADRFPSGRLVDERRLLRARALCGRGRRGDAQKVIDRFLAAKPNSALSTQMRRACPD